MAVSDHFTPATYWLGGWIGPERRDNHNTIRRHNPEDGGSMILRNFGVLPQHYMASQRRRWRQHGPPKRRYFTTTLYGFTTQKSTSSNFIPHKVQISQTASYSLIPTISIWVCNIWNVIIYNNFISIWKTCMLHTD